MSKKTPRHGPEPVRASNAEKAAEARARTERLKAALKANLGRRKAQARARAVQDNAPDDESEKKDG